MLEGATAGSSYAQPLEASFLTIDEMVRSTGRARIIVEYEKYEADSPEGRLVEPLAQLAFTIGLDEAREAEPIGDTRFIAGTFEGSDVTRLQRDRRVRRAIPDVAIPARPRAQRDAADGRAICYRRPGHRG
jgi:hypothetical protein